MGRPSGRLKGTIQPHEPKFLYDRVVIHGLDRIADYMGCTPRTITRWVRVYAFPASKLPNGGYATTTELIDRWLLSRSPYLSKFLS